MNVLDLFSGIGGFSLGLERAGMRTVAFCEIEPFCQEVLAKHWPGVPCFGDVRELSAQHLTAAGITVDVIAGGFPCQDISVAGKGAGLSGDSSGLWTEYARIIGELRPRYVIVENSAMLTNRGLDRVLGDLAAIGFDAEWHCIQAADIGAPHIRDRIWIVSYPSPQRRQSETSKSLFAGWTAAEFHNRWPVESELGRVAYGLPAQLDRCQALWERGRPADPGNHRASNHEELRRHHRKEIDMIIDLAAPADLHPASRELVREFAGALATKLRRAEEKYGYSDGWKTEDWPTECRVHLREHLEKGDPLDVAIYCAFMWSRGWPTAKPKPQPKSKSVKSNGQPHADYQSMSWGSK